MKKTLAAIVTIVASTSFSAAVHAAPAADPVAVELAKQVLKRTGEMTERAWRVSEAGFVQQLRAAASQSVQNDAKLTAEQKKKALENYDKSEPATAAKVHALFSDTALIDELMAGQVQLYVKLYTVDELRQLDAFYQSPVGMKTLANTSRVMANMSETYNRIVLPRMQKLMNEAMQNAVAQ